MPLADDPVAVAEIVTPLNQSVDDGVGPSGDGTAPTGNYLRFCRRAQQKSLLGLLGQIENPSERDGQGKEQPSPFPWKKDTSPLKLDQLVVTSEPTPDSIKRSRSRSCIALPGSDPKSTKAPPRDLFPPLIPECVDNNENEACCPTAAGQAAPRETGVREDRVSPSGATQIAFNAAEVENTSAPAAGIRQSSMADIEYNQRRANDEDSVAASLTYSRTETSSAPGNSTSCPHVTNGAATDTSRALMHRAENVRGVASDGLCSSRMPETANNVDKMFVHPEHPSLGFCDDRRPVSAGSTDRFTLRSGFLRESSRSRLADDTVLRMTSCTPQSNCGDWQASSLSMRSPAKDKNVVRTNPQFDSVLERVVTGSSMTHDATVTPTVVTFPDFLRVSAKRSGGTTTLTTSYTKSLSGLTNATPSGPTNSDASANFSVERLVWQENFDPTPIGTSSSNRTDSTSRTAEGSDSRSWFHLPSASSGELRGPCRRRLRRRPRRVDCLLPVVPESSDAKSTVNSASCEESRTSSETKSIIDGQSNQGQYLNGAFFLKQKIDEVGCDRCGDEPFSAAFTITSADSSDDVGRTANNCWADGASGRAPLKEASAPSKGVDSSPVALLDLGATTVSTPKPVGAPINIDNVLRQDDCSNPDATTFPVSKGGQSDIDCEREDSDPDNPPALGDDISSHVSPQSDGQILKATKMLDASHFSGSKLKRFRIRGVSGSCSARSVRRYVPVSVLKKEAHCSSKDRKSTRIKSATRQSEIEKADVTGQLVGNEAEEKKWIGYHDASVRGAATDSFFREWRKLDLRLRQFGICSDGIPIMDKNVGLAYPMSVKKDQAQNLPKTHSIDVAVANVDIVKAILLWQLTFDVLMPCATGNSKGETTKLPIDQRRSSNSNECGCEGVIANLYHRNDRLTKINRENVAQLSALRRVLAEQKSVHSERWKLEVKVAEQADELNAMQKQLLENAFRNRILIVQKRKAELSVAELRDQLAALVEKRGKVRRKAQQTLERLYRHRNSQLFSTADVLSILTLHEERDWIAPGQDRKSRVESPPLNESDAVGSHDLPSTTKIGTEGEGTRLSAHLGFASFTTTASTSLLKQNEFKMHGELDVTREQDLSRNLRGLTMPKALAILHQSCSAVRIDDPACLPGVLKVYDEWAAQVAELRTAAERDSERMNVLAEGAVQLDQGVRKALQTLQYPLSDSKLSDHLNEKPCALLSLQLQWAADSAMQRRAFLEAFLAQFMTAFRVCEESACGAAIARLQGKLAEHVRFYRSIAAALGQSEKALPGEVLRVANFLRAAAADAPLRNSHDTSSLASILRLVCAVFDVVQLRLNLPQLPQGPEYDALQAWKNAILPGSETMLRSCSPNGEGPSPAESTASSCSGGDMISPVLCNIVGTACSAWASHCIRTLDLMAGLVEEFASRKNRRLSVPP